MPNFFNSKNPKYEYLRQKWSKKHTNISNNFWEKHGNVLKNFTAATLGSLMIFSSPINSSIALAASFASNPDLTKNIDSDIITAEKLKSILPSEVRSLNKDEERQISQLLTREFGFAVTPEIGGIRLNRSYGFMGGEQHLYRYPGDNIYEHMESVFDWAKYGSAGIAPGLGAWGYFAPSKRELGEKDKLRERYYIAVQTFLSPGFSENVGKFRDFFKFRKMLVVNPTTGQAVVVVIGDAGPAEFTGKHLGGSPEVMDELGLGTGPRKGAVLYFFINDPEDLIPLGPVKASTFVG